MESITFSNIAGHYAKKSIVQQSASETLFHLLDISANENVLDIGCGTGNLTARIREKTEGQIVGIDLSGEMIREARDKYLNQNIEFFQGDIQDISFNNNFDVIFCNSTFQWIKKPKQALKHIYESLKPGGRIGIQAPATEEYCPNFIQAIKVLETDPRTRKIYATFTSPWFFLEDESDYRELLEACGFIVDLSNIETVISEHPPAQVFDIFSSGAIAGYLNQANYRLQFNQDYITAFKSVVQESCEKQADSDGKVKLTFNRIYLIARKPL